MSDDEIIEERVTFPRGDLTLSGILSYPALTDPQASILICPPHPTFAGNMDNNVVQALARSLAICLVTLRFDYHGIGESSIDLPANTAIFDYWDALEETGDYAPAALDCEAAFGYLRERLPAHPLFIVGYSFGAVVGIQVGVDQSDVAGLVGISPPLSRVRLTALTDCLKPCLLISGADDFVYSADESQRLQQCGGALLSQELWSGSDHFFRDEEKHLCRRINEFCLQHIV